MHHAKFSFWKHNFRSAGIPLLHRTKALQVVRSRVRTWWPPVLNADELFEDGPHFGKTLLQHFLSQWSRVERLTYKFVKLVSEVIEVIFPRYDLIKPLSFKFGIP